jgi:predicted ATP-grasp superfamily ATP-dependent carboligase|tara:strand:+ start:449 stop:625 length:177 start_codon:yes stop_codon:yes gene_type:complete
MRVFEPKKHNSKIGEALTQLYLLKKALGVQNTDTLEKQVDKIREILKELKEMLNEREE